MHPYRSHTCGALRQADTGKTVRLSGWIHRKRDHGQLLFIDLRDHYGITQLVIEDGQAGFAELASTRVESVITIDGLVVARSSDTANDRLATGHIEVQVQSVIVQSAADVLPLQVNAEADSGEDIRLRYRYLDLRREKMQRNIKLRSKVIASIRQRMIGSGFTEFQTPILTASSPEGARDFLVPARLHAGKFYALPQAPQQFKQLLMIAGFDRYFQIAPCFRDEDGRADRLAEFYQLDVEMSFVDQNEVFSTMEPVINGLFEEFSSFTGEKRTVTPAPFPRISHDEAMLKYGSDRPDLRNPLEIVDVTAVFARNDVTFKAFKGVIEMGGVVRAIRAPKTAGNPRSFYDRLNDWAKGEGAVGLGYIVFESSEADGAKGPIAKFLSPDALSELRQKAALENGDSIFFVCDKEASAAKMAGKARTRIADELGIIDKTRYALCWITDFPMYEADEVTGKIDFSHNPFSMPAGGLQALNTENPVTIKAYQYDCVCNGFELASGAIRNHKPEIMEKAFALAGYDKSVLEARFGGMLNAMRFGAPPHGGCAFGIDRIIMLFADEPNLREVYAFVMNGAFEDPMMGAPTVAPDQALKELHIKVDLSKAKISAELRIENAPKTC